MNINSSGVLVSHSYFLGTLTDTETMETA